jgi:CMP-N-acetylneuraminic acid synthetase
MTTARNSGSSFTAISLGHIMWLHSVHASMPLYDTTKRLRRQDSLHSPVVAFEDGNIYCSLYYQMKNTKTRFGDSPNLVRSSPIHSVQIDSTEDLDLARDLSQCKQVNEWMQNVQVLLPK